jgi:chromosome partitioning protein
MIISIASFKGGVGKTTTAIHTTAVLNRKALTVLLDGDPNESAIAWKERGKLSFPVINQNQLKSDVQTFKHIVLDTPARPTTDELKTICGESDLVVVPTQADGLGLDALIKLIASLKEINAKNYRILFTLIPPRSNAGKEAKELLKGLDAPFFKTEIQRRAVCGRAALKGVTVNELRGGQDAWKEFESLTKEILKYEQK